MIFLQSTENPKRRFMAGRVLTTEFQRNVPELDTLQLNSSE